MSVSVLVHCPSCHAEGNLADPALFGKAISCPVCQQVFLAPMPVEQPVGGGVSAVPSEVPAVPVSPLPGAGPEAATITAPEPSISEPSSQPVVPETAPAVPETVPVEPETLTSPVEAAEPAIQESVASTATVIQAPVLEIPPVVTVMEQPSVPAPVIVDAGPPAVASAMPSAPIGQWPVPTEIPSPAAGAWPTGVPSVTDGTEAATVATAPIPVSAGDFLLPAREVMDGPIPAFMAPVAGPGAAETMFAQSLPEPAVRGSIQPPKVRSKTLQMAVIGGVSAILLFATVMFLLGDPMRGRKPKLGKPGSANPTVEKDSGPTETMEEMLKRINASSNPGNK